MIKKLLLLTPIMLAVGCGEPAKTMERTTTPAQAPVKSFEQAGGEDTSESPAQVNAL